MQLLKLFEQLQKVLSPKLGLGLDQKVVSNIDGLSLIVFENSSLVLFLITDFEGNTWYCTTRCIINNQPLPLCTLVIQYQVLPSKSVIKTNLVSFFLFVFLTNLRYQSKQCFRQF